jgi:hypothetical protein
LDDKTPHEVWNGKKLSLTHLRVFGCDAYVHVPKENMSKMDKKAEKCIFIVHVPKENMSKMDKKAEKCIFIGYKDGLKGYNLWNPKTKKVVCSRDVVFRKIKDVVKQKVLPREEELEKIEFELKDNELDSKEEQE